MTNTDKAQQIVDAGVARMKEECLKLGVRFFAVDTDTRTHQEMAKLPTTILTVAVKWEGEGA